MPATGPPSSSASNPSTPCTWTSTNPGTITWRSNAKTGDRGWPEPEAAPGRTSTMRSPSTTSVPGASSRSGSTTVAPARTITRSVAAPAGIDLQLPAREREHGRVEGVRAGLKELAVEPIDEELELPFVRRVDHEDPAALERRKTTIVEVVAIHRHERPVQLMGELIMPLVRRPAQRVLF